MRRYQFDEFSAELPWGWRDISDQSDSSVLKLAHRFGVGTLRFSIVDFPEGVRRPVSVADLQALLDDYAKRNGLTAVAPQAQEHENGNIVAGTFSAGEDVVRVWYKSASGVVALIMHSCTGDVFRMAELREVEAIIRSVIFYGNRKSPWASTGSLSYSTIPPSAPTSALRRDISLALILLVVGGGALVIAFFAFAASVKEFNNNNSIDRRSDFHIAVFWFILGSLVVGLALWWIRNASRIKQSRKHQKAPY